MQVVGRLPVLLRASVQDDRAAFQELFFNNSSTDGILRQVSRFQTFVNEVDILDHNPSPEA